MPISFRSRVVAVALCAIAFGCTCARPPASTAAHAPFPAAPRPTLGQRAAAIAVKEVGVPYRWGGASPDGFDCSGLVYWAYRRLGVQLPHSSYALYDEGRRVAPSRMKAGDLLFFSGLGHVGMYIGRGRMVHAPHSGSWVQVVRLRGSSYAAGLEGVRRVVKTARRTP